VEGVERVGVNVGDAVTIVFRRSMGAMFTGTFRAIVTKSRDTEFDAIVAISSDNSTTIGRRLEDEGVRWCRGHSGPEVDALAAAQALR
jgi:hypothetical protein